MGEIETAQAEVTKCYEFGNTLEDIRKVAESERTALQARQETLKVEVPRMLAAEALGEATESDVAGLLEEQAAVEKALALIPLRLKGLKQREAENNGRHAKALNRLARLRASEIYRQALAAPQTEAESGVWDRDSGSNMFKAAHDVGKKGEAEELVRQAKVTYEQRFVGERR
jgi:hypothetical protein